jgi:uncharacterized protein YkwD
MKKSKKPLLHHLRHSVLPMKANDQHPQVLKREIVIGVLVFALILETAVLAQGLLVFKSPNFAASVLPAVVAELTDTQRTDNNLQPLSVNPLLSQAAQDKANDMAAKGYFSHVSPDGTLPWRWFTKAGYSYEFAGENLAINFDDSNNVVNAWMASPMHRANILKSQYTETGIGIATGMYEGHSTTFVVQFFAKPALAAAVPNVSAPPKDPAKAHVAIAATGVRKALEAMPVAASSTAPSVLGVETNTVHPNFFQKLLASPFSTASLIFTTLAAFFISVLAAGLIYRKRLPRMTATIGGLTIIVVVLGLAIMNRHFLSSNVRVDTISRSHLDTATTTLIYGA